MAINNLASIEQCKNMAKELDKKIVQSATVGFFEDNVLRAKFVGAKTVLIPEMDMSGLGKYDRDNGFVLGAINISSESYTLNQDRARTFHLDREDNDETGIANLAGEVLGEFVRTKVVPEMDAYCISNICSYAEDAEHIVTETVPYAAFSAAVNNVRDEIGYDEELVCFASPAFMKELSASAEISRSIVNSDFKKGDVNLTVKTLDDVKLLPVPSSRMKSSYTFFDGSSVDQTQGGFSPTSMARDIKFLILPKRAASLVKKSETLRVFTPEQNLKADAWKFDYRLYYDVFVKNSMKNAIWVKF